MADSFQVKPILLQEVKNVEFGSSSVVQLILLVLVQKPNGSQYVQNTKLHLEVASHIFPSKSFNIHHVKDPFRNSFYIEKGYRIRNARGGFRMQNNYEKNMHTKK